MGICHTKFSHGKRNRFAKSDGGGYGGGGGAAYSGAGGGSILNPGFLFAGDSGGYSHDHHDGGNVNCDAHGGDFGGGNGDCGGVGGDAGGGGGDCGGGGGD